MIDVKVRTIDPAATGNRPYFCRYNIHVRFDMDDISRKVLNRLEDINQIPRCSKQEGQIAAWMRNWATDRHYTVRRDDTGNLCIKIPATAGYEKSPAVIIQGHMDMVCEKLPTSKHDFANDPIRMVYRDDWVSAKETTLGADNGIALAMALVLAEDPSCAHPPLELLFTVDEESGLIGAKTLDPELIEGNVLLNLDSEDEGTFTVGCAGGQETRIHLQGQSESLATDDRLYDLTVAGLQGGHSGIDIHEQRASANKLMARTLAAILDTTELRIVSMKGGTVHNAIARDAVCRFAVSPDARATLGPIVESCKGIYKNEYSAGEPSLELLLQPCGRPTSGMAAALSVSDTRRTVGLLLALPHGVARMSAEISGLVETSSNLATVDFTPSQPEVTILSSQRSAVMSRLSELTASIESIGRLAGATTTNENSYPAWEPNMSSPLLDRCVSVYRHIFGEDPAVKAIHAGLECGLIGAKKEEMDMISFGPTIRFPHSPGEKLFIPSIYRVWKFLVQLLESFTP